MEHQGVEPEQMLCLPPTWAVNVDLVGATHLLPRTVLFALLQNRPRIIQTHICSLTVRRQVTLWHGASRWSTEVLFANHSQAKDNI